MTPGVLPDQATLKFGEHGSVSKVSGRLPWKTETVGLALLGGFTNILI